MAGFWFWNDQMISGWRLDFFWDADWIAAEMDWNCDWIDVGIVLRWYWNGACSETLGSQLWGDCVKFACRFDSLRFLDTV